jgi:hypothetical protein
LHQANLKDLKHPKLVQLLTDMQHIMVQIHIKPGIMGIIPHYEYNVGTFFQQKV